MRISVILSTYNSPQWLEKVIWGYAVQTHRNFELLIADDGSTHETRSVIARSTRESGLKIRHVWHPDRGFRKCAVLNKATCDAAADYLVFSDGDCIPRADFLEQHARLSGPGRFLSGGTVRLPRAVSEAITRHDIVSGAATDPRWLSARGFPNSRRLTRSAALAAIFDAVTTTRPTWNGCNSSAWRDDILAVNGHDERMGYGGEDRELGERLVNAGVQAVQIRHRAVCLHLDHSRSYVNADVLARNLEIRRQTRRDSSTWTPYGIEQGFAARVRLAA